jgi:CheY-like chemotaxis protein
MPILYDTTGADLAKATRLARELYLIDPSRADWRRTYLTAMLQAAKLRVGLERPLPTGEGTSYSVAAYYGADLMDDLLSHALADDYVPAATAAAQILGDIGSATLLVRGGGTPSPLARAAGHSDSRLRFAAIEAIMKLAPGQPFAGSSNVTGGLGYFARSYGVPRVLIAHPNSAEAATLAGLAAALGYEVDTATNGRDAFERAVSSPDYDFALVHSAIERPEVDYLVAQFRRDKRTAALPIGIVAPLEDLERVEAFARITPRCAAFIQPDSPDTMRIRAGDLLARSGRWHLSAAERKAHAVAALDWLARLAAHPQNVFEVYKQEPAVDAALYVPDLSTRASAVLGELGTTSAQHSLLELVNLETQPLEARQAAAAAFARNVDQFGLGLSRDEIMRQYDLYNGNAGRNGDTHVVLTMVLDAIERKPLAAAGK